MRSTASQHTPQLRYSMDRLGYSSPSIAVAALRIDGGVETDGVEMVAEETPISLAYNGVSHAVMMATPDDLEDFAVGFSLTEGLIDRVDAVSAITVVKYSRGVELQVETRLPLASAAGKRRLSGRTGCGICGKQDVEDVLRTLPSIAHGGSFSVSAVERAMRELGERQPLNQSTGAVHAAGWARRDGSLAFVREDVGRHNALDKLVGAVARSSVRAHEGFVVLTSRGSFELVQKAVMLGVSLVATVSAPTGLAIRVANDAGITLAGFARESRVTVYTHRERLVT